MSTVVGFLLGAAALAGFAAERFRRAVPVLAAAMALSAAVQLVRFAIGEQAPSASLLTQSGCFLTGGIALLLTCRSGRRAAIAAQVLAAGLVLASMTSLTGHLSQLLHSELGAEAYMPVGTAIGFTVLGIGIVRCNRGHGVGILLADPGPGGRQLRRLLPAIITVPMLMYAAALIGFQQRWYEAPVVHALLTTGNACVLAAVAIWSSDRAFALEAARVRLLVEVAEQEYQFRSTFENAFVGMGVVVEGRWLRVNDCLGRMLQREGREMIGRPVAEVLPAAVTAAFGQGEGLTLPGMRIGVGGAELFLDVGVTRLRAGSGDRWLVTLHDITELRRTAEQLMANSQEREVLLQAALADRERAERASRARDTLLAVVSHELRSPLHGMRLWASLLTKKPDADTVARAAKQIESNITAQSRLISDLVDVSRIESGRLELERTPVELTGLVERVVESLRPVAEAKDLELRLQRSPGSLTVHADAGRLEQVLRNLLDNAIKFTERGGRIRVLVAQPGERCSVVVEDSGKGMTPLQQQHAFDIFWQGDKEDTRSHGGLGLGLYLVRQIVERHQGTVSAYSEGPGRGARFAIELPLLRSAPVVVLPTPASVAAATTAGRADVLVVDDERSTGEGLVLALRFRGFPVRMAGTAEQALAMIRSQRPRVLLSDVMMPQQSGIDLITAVRREEQELQAAPMHAIAMSGRGSPSDRRRLLSAGFDDYVPKPIDIDGLVTRMETALAGPRPQRDQEGVNVLVATGDPALGARLQEGLANSQRHVVTASSAAQARALARETFPDLLVVGTQLPDGSGAALARELLEDRQSMRVIGIGRQESEGMAQVFDLLLQEPLDLGALELSIRTMRPA